MATIALVGPDGAGKTTIAKRLEAEQPFRCRYLYMGVSLTSSNLTLPTARWIRRVKQAEEAKAPGRGGRSRLRALARLANRLAEAWFRQLVSWSLELRGYTVVYDRHFVFDYAQEVVGPGRLSLDRRIHRWLVTRAFPRPDVVIFLDVPGDVLFARKGELTPDELERRRQGFLRQGERIPGFVRLDGTEAPDDVYRRVVDVARRFVGTERRSSGVRGHEAMAPSAGEHA